MTAATISGNATVGGETFQPTAVVNLPDTPPPPPPPAGNVPLLGHSMSRWPHGNAPHQAQRCYNNGDLTEAMESYPSEIRAVIYSHLGTTTASAAVAECNRIKNMAASRGLPDLEIHYAIANEADRHFSTPSAIAQFVANCKAIAPAVNAIAGCSFWMNITRDGIRTGEVEAFRVGPNDGIGMAINCYSPGRKENPAIYTKYEQFVDMMFTDCLVPWGIDEYECWEFGTEVGGRPDTSGTTATNRPDYIAGQVRYMKTKCDLYEVNFRAACYWDSVKMAGGEPDPSEPDNRLMHDEPATSNALRNAFA